MTTRRPVNYQALDTKPQQIPPSLPSRSTTNSSTSNLKTAEPPSLPNRNSFSAAPINRISRSNSSLFLSSNTLNESSSSLSRHSTISQMSISPEKKPNVNYLYTQKKLFTGDHGRYPRIVLIITGVRIWLSWRIMPLKRLYRRQG